MNKNKLTFVSSVIPDSSPNRDIMKAAKGSGILLFGYLIEFTSRFIFGIIVARSIGAEGYGLTVLGVTLATALATVARLGLSEGMVYFLPAAFGEGDKTRAWSILQIGVALPGLIGLGLGIMLFVLSDFLADKLFHESAIIPILHWSSICIPLIAMGYTLMAATRSFKKMQYHMFAENIVLNLGKVILTILFLSLGLGVMGVIEAYTITWILAVGLLLYFVSKLFSVRHSLNFSLIEVRRLISYSAPVCLTQLIGQFDGNLELILLGAMGTLASVGIYSAVLRIQMVGLMFLSATEMVAKPIISDLYHRSEIIELRRIYQTLTRWCLSFVLPFFFTAALFSKPILAIFGLEFESGWFALIILGVGMLVNAGTGICGAMIVMTGHTRLEFVNITAAVILDSVFNLILIPSWGMVGAAIATAMAIAIVNIARLLQVRWLLKIWPYNQTFIKPFIAGSIAVIGSFLTSQLIPADQNLFYLILNVAFLWIFCATATLFLGLSSDDRLILSYTRQRFNIMLHRR